MKKQSIGLLLMLLVGFSSCERKYCWNCVTTAKNLSGNTPGYQSSNKVCEMTENDADDFEKKGSSMTTSGSITIKTTTVCTKN